MTERRRNTVDRSEILDLGDYERRRDQIRPSAIQARHIRRVSIGPNATLSFENRETVRYQIQEMLRAERIAKDVEVQHEIDSYSDLLPAPAELSATLMFEFPEPQERAVHLENLLGVENHLGLEIEGAGRAEGYFDRRQLDDDRVSSVQFVRIPLDEKQLKALEEGKKLTAVIDHPQYEHRSEIPPETVAALLRDLDESEQTA
ncbi:MAG: DUF3501 family protein [Thermoanaerobaculia bacterium]